MWTRGWRRTEEDGGGRQGQDPDVAARVRVCGGGGVLGVAGPEQVEAQGLALRWPRVVWRRAGLSTGDGSGPGAGDEGEYWVVARRWQVPVTC